LPTTTITKDKGHEPPKSRSQPWRSLTVITTRVKGWGPLRSRSWQGGLLTTATKKEEKEDNDQDGGRDKEDR